MLETSVNLIPDKLDLNSPIIIASGTFGYDGYGRGYDTFDSLSKLGAVIPKTFTMNPRTGNPEPRWYPISFRQGLEDGETILLNSVGLTNPGIDDGIKYLKSVKTSIPIPIFGSISGDSVEEFTLMASKINGTQTCHALELNLSCPNTETGSMFSHDKDLVHDVIKNVTGNIALPVIAKLSPNVPNIVEIAKAAVGAGAQALTISNTIPALKIDIKTGSPVLGNIWGGLSGKSLKPISLALIYQIRKALDIPIIGVGGVFSAEDIIEYIMAGAQAVQIGSANLASLQSPIKIHADLEQFMYENKLKNLRDIKTI